MSDSRRRELTAELGRIVDRLIRGYDPLKIILFGSLASGQVGEWSDIDLVVIKDTEKPFYERLEEVIGIAQPNVGTDILVYTPAEEAQMRHDLFFQEEVIKKGRVLYEARH